MKRCPFDGEICLYCLHECEGTFHQQRKSFPRREVMHPKDRGAAHQCRFNETLAGPIKPRKETT